MRCMLQPTEHLFKIQHLVLEFAASRHQNSFVALYMIWWSEILIKACHIVGIAYCNVSSMNIFFNCMTSRFKTSFIQQNFHILILLRKVMWYFKIENFKIEKRNWQKNYFLKFSYGETIKIKWHKLWKFFIIIHVDKSGQIWNFVVCQNIPLSLKKMNTMNFIIIKYKNDLWPFGLIVCKFSKLFEVQRHIILKSSAMDSGILSLACYLSLIVRAGLHYTCCCTISQTSTILWFEVTVELTSINY